MTKVLSLDVSTRTGFAVGARFDAPRHGVVCLPKGGIGERMNALDNWLADMIQVHQPDFCIFEAPVPKMQTSARLLIALAGTVEKVCYELKVRCREERPDAARKLVLGKSRFSEVRADGKKVSANKSAVIAWCEQQGWDPDDDNSADALLLWRYAHTILASRVTA